MTDLEQERNKLVSDISHLNKNKVLPGLYTGENGWPTDGLSLALVYTDVYPYVVRFANGYCSRVGGKG